MEAILLPAIYFGGLIATYWYGKKRCVDGLFHSFSLLAVLLLIIPFGWSFGVRIGQGIAISIPLAFLGVAILLAMERHRWHDFYITGNAISYSLIDGIVTCLLFIVPFSLILTYSRTGHITWLSSDQVPNYLLQSTETALFEELVYRSLFLGYLRRFSITPVYANLIQTAYFGALHLHYLGSRDYLLLTFVLVFSLIQGYIVLKRGNLAGALLVHTASNFIPLILNNGQIPMM